MVGGRRRFGSRLCRNETKGVGYAHASAPDCLVRMAPAVYPARGKRPAGAAGAQVAPTSGVIPRWTTSQYSICRYMTMSFAP